MDYKLRWDPQVLPLPVVIVIPALPLPVVTVIPALPVMFFLPNLFPDKLALLNISCFKVIIHGRVMYSKLSLTFGYCAVI